MIRILITDDQPPPADTASLHKIRDPFGDAPGAWSVVRVQVHVHVRLGAIVHDTTQQGAKDGLLSVLVICDQPCCNVIGAGLNTVVFHHI